jgi:hypothetical protein
MLDDEKLAPDPADQQHIARVMAPGGLVGVQLTPLQQALLGKALATLGSRPVQLGDLEQQVLMNHIQKRKLQLTAAQLDGAARALAGQPCLFLTGPGGTVSEVLPQLVNNGAAALSSESTSTET